MSAKQGIIAEKEQELKSLNASLQNLQLLSSAKETEIVQLKAEINTSLDCLNSAEFQAEKLFVDFPNLQTVVTETIALKREVKESLAEINKTLKKKHYFVKQQGLKETATLVCATYETYVPTTNSLVMESLTAPFHWVAQKVGAGFAWAGLFSSITTLGGVLGWFTKTYLVRTNYFATSESSKPIQVVEVPTKPLPTKEEEKVAPKRKRKKSTANSKDKLEI